MVQPIDIFSAVNCTDNEIYNNCSEPVQHCPSTCKDLRNPDSCVETDDCEPACYCRPGYVRDENGNCIKEVECPCYHNNEPVPEGHVIVVSDCETW